MKDVDPYPVGSDAYQPSPEEIVIYYLLTTFGHYA